MLRVAVPVAVVLACTGLTLAAPPQTPIVTVYAPPSGEALAGRLQAELYAVGIEARLVPMAEDAVAGQPGPADEARAVIRVAPGGNGAEVWVADPGGAGTLRQSLVSTSRTMAAVVALRTMEFLRASLLPGPETARRPALAAPLPPRSELSTLIVAQPERGAGPLPGSSLRIGVGPALLMSPGGLGAMAAVSARLAWNPHRILGAELLGLVALTSAQVDTAEGASHFWTALAGAGAAAVLPVASRLELDAGAGMLGIMAQARGEANQSYLATTASTYAAAGYARLGVTARATERIGVRADALAGFSLQRLAVSVVPRGDVADWGRPVVAATLSVQASW